MIFFTILLPIIIHGATAAESFLRSPTAAYQIQWKEFGACPPEKRGTNEIYTDIHLTKRHQGLTEIVGKNILLVPFDDNVTINIDFAILGSNSAWLPNVYTLPLPRACTAMINLLQDGWTGYLKNMGMIPKCPIAKGVYELKGYDVNKMLPDTIPLKEFFFGRYKITIEYFRFRKLVGCAYTIVHVIPGWQRRTKNKN